MTTRFHPLVVAVAALVVTYTSRLDAQTPTTDTAAIALGRRIFQGKGLCFSCHGKAGEGVLGPTTRLAGRRLTHTRPTLPDLVALIETGVDSAHSTSGTIMPPRGGSRITDAEVEAVASYVLQLQEGPNPAKP